MFGSKRNLEDKDSASTSGVGDVIVTSVDDKDYTIDAGVETTERPEFYDPSKETFMTRLGLSAEVSRTKQD